MKEKLNTVLNVLRTLMMFVVMLAIVVLTIVTIIDNSDSGREEDEDYGSGKSRVLAVEISNSFYEDDLSDSTQIRNALKSGGMMRLNMDELSTEFTKNIERYAAQTEGGNYWVLGAILNYVASEGWELVSTPTSGLSNIYYFVNK